MRDDDAWIDDNDSAFGSNIMFVYVCDEAIVGILANTQTMYSFFLICTVSMLSIIPIQPLTSFARQNFTLLNLTVDW